MAGAGSDASKRLELDSPVNQISMPFHGIAGPVRQCPHGRTREASHGRSCVRDKECEEVKMSGWGLLEERSQVKKESSLVLVSPEL